MPGEAENIISLEKVYPMLTSIECTHDSLSMSFDNERYYRYAYRAWNSVNEAENRTFALIAGKGHCGWNTDRLPFVVKNVSFNNATKTVTTTGQVSEWKTIAHSYDLALGGRPLTKRDIDETLNIPVGIPFPFSQVRIGSGNLKFTYDCEGCGTTGDFALDLHISTTLGIPNDVSLSLSPRGVGIDFTPSIGLQAYLARAKERYPLGKPIPIGGFNIPGILHVGPEMVLDWGWKAQITGDASIEFGGTVSLPDSADLSVDLLNPSISASDWTPQFSARPFSIDTKLEGLFQVSVDANFQVGIDALGKIMSLNTCHCRD